MITIITVAVSFVFGFFVGANNPKIKQIISKYIANIKQFISKFKKSSK